jgi:hypothetical protein
LSSLLLGHPDGHIALASSSLLRAGCKNLPPGLRPWQGFIGSIRRSTASDMIELSTVWTLWIVLGA